MRKTKKQLSFILLTIVSISGCSTTSLKSTSVATHHKMTCIAPNVYVDPDMSAQQRQNFLRTVKQSKNEIHKFFGGMKSSPNIYACASKECSKHFGGVPAKAKSIDDNKVLLSSRGLDKTTLTHELAHVEFHKRLGSPHVWNKVPMWFDEGLAALVCKDPIYSKTSSKIGLDKLVTHDQWIDAVRNKKPAYSVSKQAVEAWYNNVGSAGLENVISRLQKGEKFSLENTSKKAIRVSRL